MIQFLGHYSCMPTDSGQPTTDDTLDLIAQAQPSVAKGTASLREVTKIMCDGTCSALVVTGRDGDFHVVTERDIVMAIADGADPDSEWAVDLMSVDVRTLSPDKTIADGARLMLEANIRHVVVLDPETPGEVSMVSIRDLLAPFLASLE